jgi:formate dehydrogenase
VKVREKGRQAKVARSQSWRNHEHQGQTNQRPAGLRFSARARYAIGTHEVLECWLDGRPIRDEHLMVEGGKPAGTGARSSTVDGVRKAAAAPRK